MANIFTAMWGFIQRTLGLLWPLGKNPSRLFSPAVLWVIHILVVALVLVGVYFIGVYFRLDLQFDFTNPLLRQIWLPLLVFLLYLIAWLGWAVWKVLMSGHEIRAFPDIEQAWEEVLKALDRAGISLKDAPLFLVLGRTEAPEQNLFDAARLELTVKQTPKGAEAPLHVYATRDSVYVSCANICLLGQYAAVLSLEGLEEWPRSFDAAAHEDSAAAPTGTLVPGVSERRSLPAGSEEDTVAEGRPGSALERRGKRRALNLRLPDLRRNRENLAESEARLLYLCSLIARDRQPFCPINGVLVAMPLGSTDSEDEARQAADLCQRDLATLRQGMKMRCPLFVLLCDLETTWGFFEFVGRQKPESKLQRLGQRFPLATDLDSAALREQIDSSVRWLCGHLVHEWVFHLFQVEAGPDRQAAVVQGNVKLFRLLESMFRRQQLLGLVVKNALLPGEEAPGAPPEPWFYGGCYVAATGSNKDHEQAFVRGVLDRLNEGQEFVCWTEQTVLDEASDSAQTRAGYIALAGAWLAVIAFAAWRIWFR